MKAIMAIAAVCVAMGLGFLLVNRSRANLLSGPNEAMSDMPVVTGTASVAPSSSRRTEAALPTTVGDPCMTKEEFEQLPLERQDEAMQEFIATFWSRESAGAQEAGAQENRYLSLGIFERPYVRTVAESEFARLSPQDREKAIAETHESRIQTRSFVTDAVAQAQTSMAHADYRRAEAQLISALETGRELSANRDGLLITRLTGLACQKIASKKMATLYTKTGDASKMQTMQRELGDIDAQAAEIRNVAQQQQ
jgi:hypothetical protein